MTPALRIRDLFERPVDRHIEEVIKVDQSDAAVVQQEIAEYVVTDSIRRHFRSVLGAYRETPLKPHEGIGVWISGFFGSGKSSFAKILGYVLENRPVLGQCAADLFLRQVVDPEVQVLLRTINEKIPTLTVIFNVATDRGVRVGSERITQVMYRALLRQLDYAEDMDLAELEIALESDGRLEEFERRFQDRYGVPWRQRRRLIAVALNEASAVLHDMDPHTYPSPDSWAHTHRTVDLTDNTFAERVLELVRRRAGGRTVVFVMDEVGQYVGRSTDRVLDLQGVVEALGRVGRGRVWVVVTSQERLDEVVSGVDQTRVELARLKDRFPIQVDLHPSDISEVTTRRVLLKKAGCEPALRELYRRHEGALLSHTRLHDTPRRQELDEESFVQTYPFLPYQMDLIIHIISGLRTQGGAGPHVGGSNRTLIKLAQQALIHDRVALGNRPLGALVTLDMVYDLVESNVSTEKKLEIDDVVKMFGADSWEARTAKALCLLSFVRDVRCTPENLAAVLYPEVGAPSPLPQVQAALDQLRRVQKVREGEKGWELLSAEGKRWETERQGIYLGAGDQRRWVRQLLDEVWKGVRAYRYKNLRSLSPAVYVQGERLAGRDGDVEVHIYVVEEGEAAERRIDEARDESRVRDGALVWVVPTGEGTLTALRELHRSHTMVDRYSRQQVRGEVAQLLAEERSQLEKRQEEARALLAQELCRGTLFFRGVAQPAALLGSTAEEVLHRFLDQVVPRLYHKFDLAAIPVKGDEALRLVEAADFRGLPATVYEGSGGLGLISVQGGKYAPNPDAPAAREVLSYIQQQHAQGQAVTGRALELQFGSRPYGWEVETVMLVAAALFRAGTVELTVKGRKVRAATDPGARDAFGGVAGFRATGFSPRSGGLTIQEIAAAHMAYESLFGDQVDPDEAALAAAIARRVSEERETLILPVAAAVQHQGLPGADALRQLADDLKGIAQSPSDDAIRTFAQQSGVIRQGIEVARRMRAALSPAGQETLRMARQALEVAWPALVQKGLEGPLAEAAGRLRDNLQVETWYERLPQMAQDAGAIAAAYRTLYEDLMHRRDAAYQRGVEEVRSMMGFDSLTAAQQDHVLAPLLGPLQQRAVVSGGGDLPARPSVAELESQILAAEGALREAQRRLEALLRPAAVTVRLRQFLGTSCESEADLNERLAALRDHCLKLLREGKPILFE